MLPPENASECAPTVRSLAESFRIYSGSTAVGNFEIGSNQRNQKYRARFSQLARNWGAFHA
jgi:hypothetical protein